MMYTPEPDKLFPPPTDTERLLSVEEDTPMAEMRERMDHVDPSPLIAETVAQAALLTFKHEHSELFSSQAPKQMRRRAFRIVLIAAILLVLTTIVSLAVAHHYYLLTVNHDTVTVAPASASGSINLQTPGPESSYTSLSEALTENGFPDMAPTWIPTDYALSWINTEDVADTPTISAWYIKSELENVGIFFRATKHTSYSDISETFEIEHDSNTSTIINGVEYFIAENGDKTKAIWSDGSFLCTISMPGTITELKIVLSSIQTTKE